MNNNLNHINALLGVDYRRCYLNRSYFVTKQEALQVFGQVNSYPIHINAIWVIDCCRCYLNRLFSAQKSKLCKIPNRWTVTSFTSMHYWSLIVVGAISIALFCHKRLIKGDFFFLFWTLFYAFLGQLESREFYYHTHRHENYRNESLFKPK